MAGRDARSFQVRGQALSGNPAAEIKKRRPNVRIGEDGESERRLSDLAAESGRHGAREIPHRHQNEAGRRDDPRDGVPAERRDPGRASGTTSVGLHKPSRALFEIGADGLGLVGTAD